MHQSDLVNVIKDRREALGITQAHLALELLEVLNNRPFQKEPISRRQKYDLDEAAQLGTLPFERFWSSTIKRLR